MRRHAKASSAGSIEGRDNSRGLLRRALAIRGASGDVEGSGARSHRRAAGVLAVFALSLLALALASAPAFARGVNYYLSQYGPGETPPVSFQPRTPIEDSSGNTYEVEVSPYGGKVVKWNSAHEPVLQFESNNTPHGNFKPNIVALDDSGNVYIGSANEGLGKTGVLDKFSPSGQLIWEASNDDVPGGGSLVPVGLTVGADGDVYAADYGTGYVNRFDASTGQFVSRFNGAETPQGSFTWTYPAGANQLAVDATGKIYVDAGGEVVDVFGAVNIPDAATAAPSGLVEGGVTLNGTVDPDGLELTECKFEYGLTTSYGSSVPCAETPAAIGSGSGPVPVHADLSGLPVGTYHFRLLAANVNSKGASQGGDQVAAVPGAPTLLGQSSEASYTEAELRATVNPSNLVTTYHFEYGLTAGYGLRTADKSLLLGDDPVPAEATVVQLTPGATYHFRTIVKNAIAEVVGSDQTFTAPPYPGADACPNAPVRALERIPNLGECRAYEQVSPVEKEGVPVAHFFYGTRARADGSGLLYSTEHLSLPGGATNNFVPKAIGLRGSDGWLSTPIDAPTTNSGEGEIAYRSVIAVSRDLTRVLVGSKQALAPGGVDGSSNLYIYDVPTTQYSLVATTPDRRLVQDLTGVNGGTERFIGGTPDLSMVAFLTASTGMLPGPEPEGYALYEWSETAGLRLVDDWAEPDNGSNLPHPHQVSEDGSRIYYSNMLDGRAYLSEGGTTRAISPPEIYQPSFRGSSPDGRYAIYVERGGAGRVFRYDAEADSNEIIASNASLEVVGGIDPATGDGFFTKNKEGVNMQGVYYLHDGVETLVTSGTPSLMSSTSPNGRYLLFLSGSKVTSYDSKGQGELYFYDSQTEELTCPSCRSDGGRSLGGPMIGSGQGYDSPLERHFPLSVTDQGQVFFDTPNPLVPTDVNGNRDVYTYRDGQVSLVSPGTQNVEAILNEVSPNGHDVFFSTPQRLVGQDRDGMTDMYDARVGGGFLAQNPDPPVVCLRDDCKATPNVGPELPFGGSEGLSGPGNVKAPARKRCGKGQHRVKARGKSRCVKQRHVKQPQRAKNDRRQAR